ncbi:alpha/beta hydrolase [Alphaproteobacteria bacterium]|nr:alpha/beta hydrolase [Alphaproteobacteria bacterium]
MYKFKRNSISKEIKINKINIHYLDWPGIDPTIVLLHPNRTNCRVWDFMVDASRLDNRFIAWDARGHGLSDYPEYGYDLVDYVNDLELFCESLNLNKIILIGAATGGNIALLYSSKHKDKLSKLVVADPGLSLNKSISKNVQLEIIKKNKFKNFKTAKQNMPFSSLWSKDMIDHYAFHSFKILNNNEAEWRYFPKGAQYTESLLEREMWSEINIDCKTLILRGSSSDVFPEENMLKLSGIISNSIAMRVDGCDHRISQDQPNKMAELIDKFLVD